MKLRLLKKSITFILTLSLLLTFSSVSIFASPGSLTQNAILFSEINSSTSEVQTNKVLTQLSLEGYLNELIHSSEDSAANYNLSLITPSELEYFNSFVSNYKPTHTLTFTYTNNNQVKISSKIFVSVEKYLIKPTITPMWVETAFDIGCFTLSVVEFNKKPSFWNGFWVVADAASMAFPFVPAVSGAARMIEGSTDVLKPALEKGIRPYSQLQNVTAPSNYQGKGWQRHHIFEKRFALQLGTTAGKMLSIFIPEYNYHYQITQRMKSKIPWYEAPFWSKNDILQAHINAYGELWAESGFADEYWEFLYKFAQHKQYD